MDAAHGVLVVTVVEFELAVVGTFERFTDPLGQMDITLRRACPLPTATMEHGAARAAPRWLSVLSRNLVGIVSFDVENAVTVSSDTPGRVVNCLAPDENTRWIFALMLIA